MSATQNRPSAGNWLENRTLVRHAPDAIILINGYEEFATCPSCNRTLNLQKYITSVDADVTTEQVANANFSLTIPQYELSRFMRDGVPVLQPSLEVVIFMRGYFPMKNFADLGQETNPDFDAGQVPVHPYYQVFRGVTTNVTHGYSGGFYTASVQCSNFLHFWQTQYISTNGAVFATRPKGSMVEPSLIGSKLTGMNPYEIVYTLVKATFGAAYGVEFQFSQESDVGGLDDSKNKNTYTHAAEWWSKNFAKQQGSLRMYGADGGLFNAAQQAFLGSWSSRASGSSQRFGRTAHKIYTVLSKQGTYEPFSSREALKKLKENLFNQISTTQAIASNEGGRREAIDVMKMQAFVLDIGKQGQVNLFESEYMTKSQIAQQVQTICGFELYQDVDGDIVFKPPMYNMDTSSDPVYVIEDRDLISVNETEATPEATMVKATGSHFANLAGHGINGWMGVGAVFIDYRLVAKFGYKEETFESNYLSTTHGLYISCVNRLDLANVGVKSATVSIPLRPEMRAGYPIYIRSLDCFYYVKSISQSFAFNGQCVTTLNCVAKRAKWFPPMASGTGGELPALAQVKLDSPGEYPQRPLMAYPQYLNESNSDGPPQSVGFPNVVLALDPDKVDFDSVDIPRGLLTPEAYLEIALTKGILERDSSDPTNKFILRSGNFRGQTITLKEVQEGYTDADAALAAGLIQTTESNAFGKILVEVEKIYNSVDSPEVKQLVNYLALQTSLRSYYAPGTSILGRYRYYSCAHPDADQQAPKTLSLDESKTYPIEKIDPGPPKGLATTPTFKDVGKGRGVGVDLKTPLRGIEIVNVTNLGATAKGEPTIIVPTSSIRFVTSGPQYRRTINRVSAVQEVWNEGKNFRLDEAQTKKAFSRLLIGGAISDTALTLKERLSGEYVRILGCIDTFATDCEVSGDSAVKNSKSSAEKLLSSPTYSQTAAEKNPNSDDDSAISNTVTSPAAVLWDYVSKVVSRATAIRKLRTTGETKYLDPKSANYDALMGFRAKFIRSYTQGDLIVPDSAPALIYDTAEINYVDANSNYDISWTPIYPVSDGAGYEVFGNLPYGRGVDIEKYASLLQVTREVPAGATDGAQAAAEGKTNIQNYGVNASSLEEVENFLAAWAVSSQITGKTPTAAAILQNQELFSESDQAAILAALNTNLGGVQGVMEAITKGETAEAAFIRNKPVTSFSRGQSLTSEAAAENLARLTYGEVACSCRGSDAAFLVQALSEEFVEAFGTDPLIPWMREDVYAPASGVGDYTKKVLSGEYRSTQNDDLSEKFEAQGKVVDNYAEAGANLNAGITQALRRG